MLWGSTFLEVDIEESLWRRQQSMEMFLDLRKFVGCGKRANTEVIFEDTREENWD